MTVWKFKLWSRGDDRCVVEMPRGAEILTVAEQGGTIYLWARVNADAMREARVFYIHGTGHPIDRDAGPYVGTVHMMGGAFVVHVFEQAA